MRDRYFSDFRFKKLNITPFGVGDESSRLPNNHTGSLRVENEDWAQQNWSSGIVEDSGVAISKLDRLTGKEVQKFFVLGLKSLSKEIGEPLSLVGRRLLFVTEEEMRLKIQEDAQRLQERYGEYILKGAGGGCYPNPDGSFTLRIVDYGEDEDLLDSRMHRLAHEYGHTLGNGPLEQHPVCEELKAYAFQELFIHHLFGVKNYTQPADDDIHEMAWYRMQQLRNAGIREEAMIAHVIGRPFGRFRPGDYSYFYRSGIVQARALGA